MASMAFVQSVTNTAISSPITVTINCTAGNLLMVNVAIAPGTSTLSSTSDTNGGSYNSLASVSGGGATIVTLASIVRVTGSNTVTVNCSGTPTAVVIEAREYSFAFGTPAAELSPTINRLIGISSIGTNSSGSNVSLVATRTPTGKSTLFQTTVANSRGATYTPSASFDNPVSVTQGSLVMTTINKVLEFPEPIRAGGILFTQSDAGAWTVIAGGILARLINATNNFEFPSAPDGISVTEKIR